MSFVDFQHICCDGTSTTIVRDFTHSHITYHSNPSLFVFLDSKTLALALVFGTHHLLKSKLYHKLLRKTPLEPKEIQPKVKKGFFMVTMRILPRLL